MIKCHRMVLSKRLIFQFLQKPDTIIKESKQTMHYIYFLFSRHYDANLIKKLELCLIVASVLLKIKFGYTQIGDKYKYLYIYIYIYMYIYICIYYILYIYTKLFYSKVSSGFLQQDSQSWYSLGKTQNVGGPELSEEKI